MHQRSYLGPKIPQIKQLKLSFYFDTTLIDLESPRMVVLKGQNNARL
jgi:hypothetical protein